MKNSNPASLLLAGDDKDDQLLAREALREARMRNDLFCVENSVELLIYLPGLASTSCPDATQLKW
jgi:hypothetical protein